MQPGDQLTSWVDPRLEMRPSPISGHGLFARQPIQAGEVLIVWGGTVFSLAEVRAGKADPESLAVLAEGLYLGDPVGAYPCVEFNLNHACDPNLWMQDAIRLAARRAIAAGEELTADYALWLYEQDWALAPCRCGSPLCRGKVTAQDWRIPELQVRYAGHFTPFLNAKIQNQKP